MEGKTGLGAGAISLRLAAIAVVEGLIGAYPTWKYAGAEGLFAQAVSGLIVLAAMIASVILVMRQIQAGPAKGAMAAAFGGMLRAVAVLGLWAAAWQVLKLPPITSIMWLAAFYFPLLAAESMWMSRALLARG
ncbi:MAG: hypothetical protein WC869_13060 [Phycisphaerae bacterium]|jgi:hypothetical protein